MASLDCSGEGQPIGIYVEHKGTAEPGQGDEGAQEGGERELLGGPRGGFSEGTPKEVLGGSWEFSGLGRGLSASSGSGNGLETPPSNKAHQMPPGDTALHEEEKH